MAVKVAIVGRYLDNVAGVHVGRTTEGTTRTTMTRTATIQLHILNLVLIT